MNTILEVKNLFKTYTENNHQVNVLKNIDFCVDKGSMVAVLGPSGSGKSTLVYTMSGIETTTYGTVRICGKEITTMNSKEKSRYRLEKIGLVFQQANMMRDLSVYENIILPALELHHGENTDEINLYAIQLMQKTGISKLSDHSVETLSGGELQRAAICRALINQPEIIFADEPTGSLNKRAANDIVDLLTYENRKGVTVLIVTHDLNIAAHCDYSLYLDDGMITDRCELGKYIQPGELHTRCKLLSRWLETKEW